MLLASIVQGRQVHIWHKVLLLDLGSDCGRNFDYVWDVLLP